MLGGVVLGRPDPVLDGVVLGGVGLGGVVLGGVVLDGPVDIEEPVTSEVKVYT